MRLEGIYQTPAEKDHFIQTVKQNYDIDKIYKEHKKGDLYKSLKIDCKPKNNFKNIRENTL